MAYVEDKYIEQAISDFDEIERAIIENGVDVPHGTDTKEYGKLINQIGEKKNQAIADMEKYKEVSTWFAEYYLPSDPMSNITIFNNEFIPQIIPAIDFSKHENFDFFCAYNNTLERAIVNSENGKSFMCAFFGCLVLKYVEIDLSKAEIIDDIFAECYSIEYIKIKPNSLKISISIPSECLTDEAIQVLIDSLAYVEEAQTLTLSSTIYEKLTDEQIIQMTAKNWL